MGMNLYSLRLIYVIFWNFERPYISSNPMLSSTSDSVRPPLTR